ncbi:hypothetical protein RirG_206410 [Rhizophagus irregularis DAOM 197198w]|uniref:Uncharacterized protein n=1 Tax=Rhizophagus irregularis (strain DAOM 197198w) TaxID=1432141 RepID=A0A015IK31_RHIIW|nr:hypothetical protein RirG_206410 [Rhizophagus irregularis DAOM 197198w]
MELISTKDCCDCCESIYSKTLSRQKYCKNCLFDYVNNLTDNNIYLDVIYEIVDRCIEHKDSDTQNIQEWCNNCSKISHFNQIAAKDRFDYSYHNTKCKLCEKVYNGLCSNCYFISFEWIESTLVKNPIPIVYLPWWDYSRCRYCLTTNIIFGITEQSKCRKCKRVIDIDVTGIDEIIIINKNIVNWENNIKQGSNLVDSAYQFIREFYYCNNFDPIKE